jgi:hypothetical protein
MFLRTRRGTLLRGQAWQSVAVTSAMAVCGSCSFGPAAVKPPAIDASSAGSLAMEQYDANGDGVVSGQELEKSPPLKAALARLDTNGDQAVSADEVAARINAWQAMRTGLTSVRCHVTLDGRPLTGADVVFEPEAFLGDEVKTARGKTNQFGDAAPTVPPEDRPEPDLPGGVHFGLYRVRISTAANGRELLPSHYNTETVLGQEVSYDDPAMQNNNMAFALKSRP